MSNIIRILKQSWNPSKFLNRNYYPRISENVALELSCKFIDYWNGKIDIFELYESCNEVGFNSQNFFQMFKCVLKKEDIKTLKGQVNVN